jgi:hypothetical protein
MLVVVDTAVWVRPAGSNEIDDRFGVDQFSASELDLDDLKDYPVQLLSMISVGGSLNWSLVEQETAESVGNNCRFPEIEKRNRQIV